MNKIDIKKNVYKKVLALLLTSTVALAGTGCGKKEKDVLKPLFEDTLLEDTVIIETDLGTVVAKREESWELPYYIDIVTGNSIQSGSLKSQTSGNIIITEKLEEKGFVTEYLTKEELLLAQENLLTEENIVDIIYRIINSEKTTDTKKLIK